MTSPHCIRTLRFDLRTPQPELAFRLRQRVAEGMQAAAFSQALETLLDRLAPGDVLVRLDRLIVPLGRLSGEDFEKNWMPRCLDVLETTLRDALARTPSGSERAEPDQFSPGFGQPQGESEGLKNDRDPESIPTVHRLPESEATLEAVRFFLETGRLPWWATAPGSDQAGQSWADWERVLLQTISQHPARAVALLRPVLAQPGATYRLVWQFSKNTVLRLIAGLFGEKNGQELREIQTRLRDSLRPLKMNATEKREILENALILGISALVGQKGGFEGMVPSYVLKDTVPTERSTGDFTGTTSGSNSRPPTAKSVPRTTENTSPDSSEKSFRILGVSNAGLVVLHPFLVKLFEELGLVENQAFGSEAARHRAVHLLAYLAGLPPNPPEPALLVPKLLVGLPPEAPIQRRIRLTKSEKTEAFNLLRAVIEHWSALKNASPQSVQETFLQREGSLTRRGTDWFLTLESRSVDVLLDRLPWNFSLIRLPWMPILLHVEWGMAG